MIQRAIASGGKYDVVFRQVVGTLRVQHVFWFKEDFFCKLAANAGEGPMGATRDARI